jgi:2-oxoglutarate ferredoxin oxidoreductase subunit alpha
VTNLHSYLHYEYQEDEGADILLVSHGITARAAQEAVRAMHADGVKVSLLLVKTLLPVSDEIYDIIGNYKRVFIAEENLTGQYRQILFGTKSPAHISGINKIGNMISPMEIMEEIAHERK